jgi:uncharacterized protein YneF (UPF0154 family)
MKLGGLIILAILAFIIVGRFVLTFMAIKKHRSNINSNM